MQGYEVQVKKNVVFSPGFETAFFNTADYVIFHQPKEFYSFALIQIPSGNIEAICNLFINDNKAFNPFRAPFGFIETTSNLPIEQIDFFIKTMIAHCNKKKLSSIQLVSYPECYQPGHANLIRELLLLNGFPVNNSELNQHLSVSNSNFEQLINPAAKRRLKKCENSGFDVIVNSNKSISEIYDFLKNARIRKQFPLTIDLDSLQRSIETFPDRYTIFTVEKDEALAAMAIGVKVSSKVIYYYLPADSPEYLEFSPAILIVKKMYEYAQKHGFEILDLGISTYMGERNEGLIRFKKNLGGMESKKNTFLRR